MEKQFKKVDGKKIDDYLEYVNDYIKNNPEYDWKIYVGSDSQLKKQYILYTTVIAFHKFKNGQGKGAHYIMYNDKMPRNPQIFMRLWGEVERIMEIIIPIRDSGVELYDNVLELTPHFDLTQRDGKIYKSNQVTNSAIGYASSFGFEAEVKPTALAASYAADRHCK